MTSYTPGSKKAVRGFHLKEQQKFPSLWSTHKVRSIGNPNKGSGKRNKPTKKKVRR